MWRPVGGGVDGNPESNHTFVSVLAFGAACKEPTRVAGRFDRAGLKVTGTTLS